MYDPQPITDRPLGMEFPHRSGRFRPGGSPILSPGCRSCNVLEEFAHSGMETYPPRGAVALCTIPSKSATGQWGWGFHTVWDSFDPGDHRSRPQVVGVVYVWRDFRSGDGNLSSPGGAGFTFEPQPIIDRPARLGFPHRAGRFQPGG